MRLDEKYRPKSLKDFVGIAQPRAVLEALAAAPYESAWLLEGPSGVGKTTIATAFADSIRGEVHSIPSQTCNLDTVKDTVRSCWYSPMLGGDWHVVIANEADKMSAPAQIAFLSILEHEEFPPKTIFLFTCNSTVRLEGRFLSRVRRLRFQAPEPMEVLELLTRIWRAEAGPDRPLPNVLPLLESRQINVRDALGHLEVELMAEGYIAPIVPKAEQRPEPDLEAELTVSLETAPRSRNMGPVDPARSAAAKRAWETIRANRARAAAERRSVA